MYYPTFDITDDMLEDLRTGKVSIQTGQWVRLPMSIRKVRWIGVCPNETVVVQHYEGSYTPAKFRTLVKYHRDAVKAERVRAILDSHAPTPPRITTLGEARAAMDKHRSLGFDRPLTWGLTALLAGFVLLASMVLLGCAPKRVDIPAATDYGCTVDSIDAGWASVETPGGMAATPTNPHWVEGQSVPCPE
jgi:hypothetical protein